MATRLADGGSPAECPLGPDAEEAAEREAGPAAPAAEVIATKYGAKATIDAMSAAEDEAVPTLHTEPISKDEAKAAICTVSAAEDDDRPRGP